MSTFSIENISKSDICVELTCNKCGNKFSTELDTDFQNQELPVQSEGVLYCLYCENAYEYTILFNNNKLEIIFKNDELFGGLKNSEKVYLEIDSITSPIISKRFYFLQIERLEKILKLKSGEHIVDQALFRLVYSGIITSLETYLNEILSQIVFYSEGTMEKFISDYEPYKKEKISLNEIIKRQKSINFRIQDDLDNFIYHNIPKLISTFSIYNFELDKYDKIQNIAKYIQKRHNLVHKSGINKDDSLHEIYEPEITSVIKDINLFVEYIDEKINEKCFLLYDNFNLIF
jgi:hypothetical protein